MYGLGDDIAEAEKELREYKRRHKRLKSALERIAKRGYFIGNGAIDKIQLLAARALLEDSN
jgi:hypothetical protein